MHLFWSQQRSEFIVTINNSGTFISVNSRMYPMLTTINSQKLPHLNQQSNSEFLFGSIHHQGWEETVVITHCLKYHTKDDGNIWRMMRIRAMVPRLKQNNLCYFKQRNAIQELCQNQLKYSLLVFG